MGVVPGAQTAFSVFPIGVGDIVFCGPRVESRHFDKFGKPVFVFVCDQTSTPTLDEKPNISSLYTSAIYCRYAAQMKNRTHRNVIRGGGTGDAGHLRLTRRQGQGTEAAGQGRTAGEAHPLMTDDCQSLLFCQRAHCCVEFFLWLRCSPEVVAPH